MTTYEKTKLRKGSVKDVLYISLWRAKTSRRIFKSILQSILPPHRTQSKPHSQAIIGHN